MYVAPEKVRVDFSAVEAMANAGGGQPGGDSGLDFGS